MCRDADALFRWRNPHVAPGFTSLIHFGSHQTFYSRFSHRVELLPRRRQRIRSTDRESLPRTGWSLEQRQVKFQLCTLLIFILRCILSMHITAIPRFFPTPPAKPYVGAHHALFTIANIYSHTKNGSHSLLLVSNNLLGIRRSRIIKKNVTFLEAI